MTYIDVDKFAEKICNFQAIDEDCANKMIWLLRTFPTADVKEVKHGYWKWEKKIEPQAQNRLYCSVCDNECLGKNNYYVKSEYCHFCGTRMDGTPKERGGEK